MRLGSTWIALLLVASLGWIAACYPEPPPPGDDDDDDLGDDDLGDDDAGDDDAGDDDGADDDAGDDDAGDDDAGDDDGVPSLAPGDVVITEIMYDPAAVNDSDGEWFEVLNTTGGPVDLLGCELSDAGGGGHVIGDAVPLPAGGRAVFGRSDDTGVNGGVPVDHAFSFSLTNGADEVILTCGATEIDRVEYDTDQGWPGDAGVAMNLDEADLDDNHLAASWCDAETAMGNGDLGTPGAGNDACGGGPIDDDGDGYSPPADCDDSDPDVNPGEAEVPGNGIDDNCNGQIDEGGPGIQPGDVVFTEVMQNPGVVADADGEWFELRNTTGAALDLVGCGITDLGSDSMTVVASVPIPAGGYAVFADTADPGTNGGVTVDYEWGSFTLGNSDDELILRCPAGGTEIDRVEWDGGPGWPDPEGASMTLDEAFLAQNNDGAHWCEASSSYGQGDLGTPGSSNDGC